jgi:hypothetical protein
MRRRGLFFTASIVAPSFFRFVPPGPDGPSTMFSFIRPAVAIALALRKKTVAAKITPKQPLS